MRRLVFLLEESSMREALEVLLPRILPTDTGFLLVVHEGKSDLERSIPRKLRAWRVPGDCFVVVRDNDGAVCTAVKAHLAQLCQRAGRPETLVRIVCQHLETWFLGDLAAVEQAFGIQGLVAKQDTRKMRNPDRLTNAHAELQRLVHGYGKVSGARAIAPHLDVARNRSRSFEVFVAGVRRLAASEEPPRSFP